MNSVVFIFPDLPWRAPRALRENFLENSSRLRTEGKGAEEEENMSKKGRLGKDEPFYFKRNSRNLCLSSIDNRPIGFLFSIADNGIFINVLVLMYDCLARPA